ncbi:MAG TPA: hypothetical protein PKH39_15975 [Woeseiaceae bacterium]|nr:hypothetical protein [Woeseiaceae bacterium]
MMLRPLQKLFLAVALSVLLSACGGDDANEGRKVDASGKEVTGLDSVPAEVLAAAKAARPDLVISGAEFETRNGKEYYDVGGTLPDGSEWELDITRIDGVWTVAEVQRDIGMDLVPEPVSGVLETKFPGWSPNRIIESDQGDGVVVYEFFGKDTEGENTKVEVKLEEGHAELLIDEWVH